MNTLTFHIMLLLWAEYSHGIRNAPSSYMKDTSPKRAQSDEPDAEQEKILAAALHTDDSRQSLYSLLSDRLASKAEDPALFANSYFPFGTSAFATWVSFSVLIYYMKQSSKDKTTSAKVATSLASNPEVWTIFEHHFRALGDNESPSNVYAVITRAIAIVYANLLRNTYNSKEIEDPLNETSLTTILADSGLAALEPEIMNYFLVRISLASTPDEDTAIEVEASAYKKLVSNFLMLTITPTSQKDDKANVASNFNDSARKAVNLLVSTLKNKAGRLDQGIASSILHISSCLASIVKDEVNRANGLSIAIGETNGPIIYPVRFPAYLYSTLPFRAAIPRPGISPPRRDAISLRDTHDSVMRELIKSVPDWTD